MRIAIISDIHANLDAFQRVLEDIDLLRMARRDAFALAHEDPFLKKEKHQILREELLRQFGDTLQLVDVG